MWVCVCVYAYIYTYLHACVILMVGIYITTGTAGQGGGIPRGSPGSAGGQCAQLQTGGQTHRHWHVSGRRPAGDPSPQTGKPRVNNAAVEKVIEFKDVRKSWLIAWMLISLL